MVREDLKATGRLCLNPEAKEGVGGCVERQCVNGLYYCKRPRERWGSAVGKDTFEQGDGASSEGQTRQRPDDSWHWDCRRNPKWLGIICILLFFH